MREGPGDGKAVPAGLFGLKEVLSSSMREPLHSRRGCLAIGGKFVGFPETSAENEGAAGKALLRTGTLGPGIAQATARGGAGRARRRRAGDALLFGRARRSGGPPEGRGQCRRPGGSQPLSG